MAAWLGPLGEHDKGELEQWRKCLESQSRNKSNTPSAAWALCRLLRRIPSAMAAEEAHAKRKKPDLKAKGSGRKAQVRIFSGSRGRAREAGEEEGQE